MATDITGLLNKVENKGQTPQGKLSANEFNTLVKAVQENQNSVKSISYNGGSRVLPDERGNVDLIITESNYVLKLKTTVDGTPPYKIALGNIYTMTIEVSNKYVEGDEYISASTACSATFYCNGTIVNQQEVYDGDVVSFNFGDFFVEGKNEIYVIVDNHHGVIQRTLVYEVTAVFLSIQLPNFNPLEIQTIEGWGLDVKVIGSNAKIFVYIDGNGGLIGNQTAGSTVTYPITLGLTTGAHKLQVYAVAEDDDKIQTDAIITEYIYSVPGSTNTVIATLLKNYTTVELYEIIAVKYWVYKPNYNGTLQVTLGIINDSEEYLMSTIQNVSFIDGVSDIHQWDLSINDSQFINKFTVVRISTDNEVRDIPIKIIESEIKLTHVDGYDLLLSSVGKSNNDINPDDWSFGEYKVTFPEDLEFSSIASGWNYDSDGNVALHLRKGREITLNYYPFENNPAFGNGENVSGTKKGMTFSIEFATRNCVKRDASVVRCIHDGVGFELFANSMIFSSNKERLTADYKEDTRVRIDLVIEGQPITYTYDDGGVSKTSDEARMIVYVDGVYQQMLLISSESNFAQSIPQMITIGSEYCAIDIYNIRAYRSALDIKGITDNYSFDTPNTSDKINIAKRCDVFDSRLQVSYPKLLKARPELPIMLIGMQTLPNSKDKLKVATTSYNNPLNQDDYDAGNPSFESKNDEMGNQGTSSMNYPMPYRNFDWKKGSDSMFVIGSSQYKKWPLYAGMPPISKFTFKKDYASSEMANNIICSELFNQMAVGLADVYPNCRNTAQQTIDDNKYRLGLKGIPFFMFQYWNNTYTPMGMFNFIPNKNEHEYLGFTSPYTWKESRAQSWEIRDNKVFWDFEMREPYWDAEEGKQVNDVFAYYEAIYPKDNTTETSDFGNATTEGEIENAKNETKDLLRLHNWLTSTNQLYATGNGLKQPYTDIYGITHLYDNARYRLAKFQTEHEQYLVLDQWILYYIWREQFWMYDSGSKNLQLHTYDGQHWGCHVRDCDTGLGSDNEGKLIFPPYLEDTDYILNGEFVFNQTIQPEGSVQVLNGQLGAIWINIRDGFKSRIQQMYSTLYTRNQDTKFNYQQTVDWFEKHQGSWSEALYNFGSKQYHGGSPYSKWISSGLGDKKNQRKYWLYYGFRYRASKYHADSASNRITWRIDGTIKSDLQIKTYSQMYVCLGFGNQEYNNTTRYRCLDLNKGVLVKNETNSPVNNMVMYLFNGDMITDIGNLYEFGDVYSFDLTSAIRLRELRIGNHANNQYVNTKLDALQLNTCEALEHIDLSNCKGFGTGAGQGGKYNLDLSKQVLLQELYCSGSTLTGITFPETPSLKYVNVGSNLTELKLTNLTGLQTFVIDSGINISSIIIKNCSDVSKYDSYDIISSIIAEGNTVLNTIDIEGIDWQNANPQIIEILCDKHAKLKGKIHIGGQNQVSTTLKKKLLNEYGNIDDPNNVLYITYEVRPIKTITMSPKQYFTEPGTYQLSYNLDSPYANNFISEKWDLDINLYATINKNTGELKVHTIGEEVDGNGPFAVVTITITLSDGSTMSATSELNFWYRKCKLGDVIYHDGSFSSPQDYLKEVASGKSAVGVCFYIDPFNENNRLMVALKNLQIGRPWGMYEWQTLPQLQDHPDLNLHDILNIPNIWNGADENAPNDWEDLRDDITGDIHGWKYFDPQRYVDGQIGWKTINNEFEVGGGYYVGDSVPYGKYYTAQVIETRNKLLQDPVINLQIPSKTDKLSEINSLDSLINEIVSIHGDSKYQQYYYPLPSYCYAYVPSNRQDLKQEFREHNWWLPTVGEMRRIGYYYNKYLNKSTDNLNIFKDVLDNGIMQPFIDESQSNHMYITVNEGILTYGVVWAINMTKQWSSGLIDKSSSQYPMRPICSF